MLIQPQCDAPPISEPTETELALCVQIVCGLRGGCSLPKNRLPNIVGGRVISDEVATATGDFGIAWAQRHVDLSEALNIKDRDKLVRAAFGNAFPELADDWPADFVARTLCGKVNESLRQDIKSFAHPREFHFGCWLVRDQELTFDLGPVQITPREQWLAELKLSGTIDGITATRVRRAWRGNPLRKRKSNDALMRERSVVDVVGDCPDVCTVKIANMASGIGEEKALLTARLALTVVSLLWEQPSRAFEGFGLLVDGGPRGSTVLATQPDTALVGRHGRARRLPGTTWTSDDLSVSLGDIDWLRGPAGEALAAFANGRLPHSRDAIDRAIFLAIWWMHEAIVADTALMATAKFGAALDTLAGGRGKPHHIENMLSERLGIAKTGGVTRRGETLNQIVGSIYKRARSSTLHGLNDQFGRDWTETRGHAEWLARGSLLATLELVHDNAIVRLPDYS